MSKIGRNHICPCGSKKKFKKCCGDPLKQKSFVRPTETLPEIAIQRLKAAELRRQQQQGLGKPIISAEFKNHRFVAIGNDLVVSAKAKTFPDFLLSNLPTVMGKDWSVAEMQKEFAARHPIFQWYQLLRDLQKKCPSGPDGLFTMPTTGAASCVLGLANNLYLLQHNAELQKRFIERLKDINNFQGVYYELIVAGCMIHAGFELELEDESDESSKHCEFSAISKKTGKKYWIEAKARSVIGVLGKTELNGTRDKEPTSSLSKHISEALKKPADAERFIFVDVNALGNFQEAQPAWAKKAWQKLDARERDLKPEESAYVFVTNMNFHLHLDDAVKPHCVLAHGLGIKDFGKPGWTTLKEKYRKKQKHIDAHEPRQRWRHKEGIEFVLQIGGQLHKHRAGLG